jgi:hypothetical protein
MSSSCSVPASTPAYGGMCRSPNSDCVNKSGLPELAAHTFGDSATLASENAFVNRYTPLGGKRRKQRSRRRKRSSRSRTRTNTRRKRYSRRKSQYKRRGGVGYRLDLEQCPDGGIASPVGYQTNSGDMV